MPVDAYGLPIKASRGVKAPADSGALDAMGKALLGDDDAFLPTLGRWVSRPMYAVTSALQGDMGGVGANLAQMALDFPTGGFFNNNLSLANLLDSDGDLTSARQRREPSSVLGGPKSVFGKFAFDVGVGALIDPLTYMSFGTSALVKGGLKGASRKVAGTELVTHLRKTPKGKKALDDALASLGDGADDIAAAEKVLGTTLGDAATGDAAELAAEHLKDLGLLKRGEGLRLSVPFTGIESAPLKSVTLGNLGRFGTVPGLLHEGAKRTKLGAAASEAAGEMLGSVKTALWDKAFDRRMTEGARRTVQHYALEQQQALKTVDLEAQDLFGALDDVQNERLGDLMLQAEDAFYRGVPEASVETTLLQQAHQTGGDEAVRAVQGYLSAMRDVPQQLRELGVWKAEELGEAAANPFYVPHQIANDLAGFMADGSASQAARQGIRDVFSKRREYPTRETWVEALRGKAEQINRDYGTNFDLGDANSLTERHLGGLFRDRLRAHAGTTFRAKVWNTAKEQWGLDPLKPDHVLDYVQRQFKHADPTSNVVLKVLGGGKFTVPAESARAKWLEGSDRVRVKKVGTEKVLEWSFPGLNSIYKPLLTTSPANVGFHVRNALSAVFMSAFDRELGPSLKPLLNVFDRFPVLKHAQKLSTDSTTVRHLVDAAVDNDKTSLAALQGTKIGKHDATDLVGHLRAILGNTSRADLMLDVQSGMTDRLGRDLVKGFGDGAWERIKDSPRKLRQVFREWTATGERIANHIERGFRANSFMELVRKGNSLDEAARRTGDSFVKYDVQSEVHKTLRSVIPFAQFQIGSAAWLGSMARQPKTFTPLARAQGSNAEQDETGLLPSSVRDSAAFKFGQSNGLDRYAVGFGLPHEASLNLLQAIPTPGRGFEGTRKVTLGGLAPPVKLGAQALTGTNFFFGGEFGSYRRAPSWLPDALTETFKGKDGKVRREVPGWVNETLGSLPLARIERTVDRHLDDRKDAVSKWVQTLTGVRFQHVDVKRELVKRLSKWAQAEVSRGRLGVVENFFSRMAPEDTPEEIKVGLETMRRARKKK